MSNDGRVVASCECHFELLYLIARHVDRSRYWAMLRDVIYANHANNKEVRTDETTLT